MKIVIFEDDLSVAKLLTIILNGLGYSDIEVCSDPSSCPICTDLNSTCEKGASCADVLICDNKMPIMSGVKLFKLQSERNCKLNRKNAALMSAGLTEREEKLVIKLGCHFIKKPFEVDKIEGWLKECEKRIENTCTFENKPPA